MFCEKCGAEVKTGANFCPRCGAEMVNSVVTGYPVKSQNQIAVDREDEKIYQVWNTGLERVKSVEDPGGNDKLFAIYAKVVKPMAEMEQANARFAENEKKIESLTPPVKMDIVLGLGMTWAILWRAEIAAIIAGFILPFIPALNKYTVFSELVYALVSLLPLILGILFGFFGEWRNARSSEKNRKAELASLQQEQPVLESMAAKAFEDIRELVCFIPPKYRYSDAVKYFVNAYENSRVDNLKEAVNSYENYLFREKSLEMQKMSAQSAGNEYGQMGTWDAWDEAEWQEEENRRKWEDKMNEWSEDMLDATIYMID